MPGEIKASIVPSTVKGTITINDELYDESS